MVKKQALRDYTTYPYNPFRIESRHIIPSKKQKGEFIMPVVIGEVEALAFNVPADGIDMYDRQDSIRLFHDAVDKIPELSTAAQKILFYVFKELTNNVDEVHLHIATLMESLGFKNTRSVYDGILDLLAEQFIARKTGGDMFYINPAYFFRNGRANWYKNVSEYDKKKPAGDRIHQPSIKASLKLSKSRSEVEVDNAITASKSSAPCIASLETGSPFAIDGASYILWKVTDDSYLAIDPDLVMAPDALKSNYAISFDGSELID